MKQILKEGLRPSVDPLDCTIMFLQGSGASELLGIWVNLVPQGSDFKQYIKYMKFLYFKNEEINQSYE